MSTADQITTAQLWGTASRHATTRVSPGCDAWDRAVRDLATIAESRTDLITEAVGLINGAHLATDDDYQRWRTMAELLTAAAGEPLDPAQLERWKAEGTRRRNAPRPGQQVR